ncbi:hypothetical protein CLG96_10395 [Sphingomonas oleivorans]|uniref:Uncharacterized protein n=1 Tax=Sphingomonas oleivorans TaxID=1735121 RepID=A0A2T5FXF7_9SPHN|nr:hypothetical protein [Sphingomonas oleivorans]PTQ10802.1 hypothetical protein CLG96_10395 [Sphingomonas oleivorans]
MRREIAGVAVAAMLAATPVLAAKPREILMAAAFQTSDRKAALAEVGRAIEAADAILAANPRDREAQLQRAIGIGYRAKLTRNRGDAKTSHRMFEALAAADPRDAEAQVAIAGWHLDAIDQLGGMLARMAIGAREGEGLAALDRAVALGGDRAFFPGVASLMRIRADKDDVARARRLAEAAATAPAPTPLDRLMKRNAAALLPALRAHDGKAAAALARELLPFGRLD